MPNKAIGIAILVLGVILLVFGIQASDSLSSSFSKFFTGNPTDKAIWFIIGGAVSLILGLYLSLSPRRAA